MNSYMQPQLCSMPSYSSAIGYRSVSTYGDRAGKTLMYELFIQTTV